MYNIYIFQRQWKGWGYGAAAPPDFKSAPYDFIYLLNSPTWFDYLPPPMRIAISCKSITCNTWFAGKEMQCGPGILWVLAHMVSLLAEQGGLTEQISTVTSKATWLYLSFAQLHIYSSLKIIVMNARVSHIVV